MADPARLNYHHLHYFWAVAHAGSLTSAARSLHVAQSALSTQIRRLEEQLGEKLFLRRGRSLALTEAGRIALTYADTIFARGAELLATFAQGRSREQALRVGAVATLSRNFQDSFIAPLLDRPELSLRMQSGSLDELLSRLSEHQLDIVLSNRAVGEDFRCRRIARQEVSLIGSPIDRPFRFPEDLQGAPLLLPGPDSAIRMAFDVLCEEHGIEARVRAEVDDMAMARLVARDADAVALLPSVVVRDELRSGALQEYCIVPDLYESFYGITVQREYPHPLLEALWARSEREILAMAEAGV